MTSLPVCLNLKQYRQRLGQCQLRRHLLRSTVVLWVLLQASTPLQCWPPQHSSHPCLRSKAKVGEKKGGMAHLLSQAVLQQAHLHLMQYLKTHCEFHGPYEVDLATAVPPNHTKRAHCSQHHRLSQHQRFRSDGGMWSCHCLL
mmetsp:Transcript_62925/g.159288  ORF Transcript_62925/g.159288 Transcript_62925/m.159288 type:complete len:143 (+) Transcript_62925:755-1183(+)